MGSLNLLVVYVLLATGYLQLPGLHQLHGGQYFGVFQPGYNTTLNYVILCCTVLYDTVSNQSLQRVLATPIVLWINPAANITFSVIPLRPRRFEPSTPVLKGGDSNHSVVKLGSVLYITVLY